MEASDGRADAPPNQPLGYQIAEGDIDVLQLDDPGPFSELTVQSLERTSDGGDVFQNGGLSDYAVTFTARIPVMRRDIFFLEIPPTITPPKGKNLVCDVTTDESIIPADEQCLDQVGKCDSQGRALLIELEGIKEWCEDLPDTRYSFVIRGV